MTDSAARQATTTLSCHPAAASVARRFARRLAPPGTAATVELLVSELVTNAVIHAHSQIILTVSTRSGAIRVEVRDASPCLPHAPPANGAAAHIDLGQVDDHGRGLQLVDVLATRWGSRRLRGGKSVWFEVEAKDSQARYNQAILVGSEAGRACADAC